MNSASPINFDNSYADLPARFFAEQKPEPVASPGPIKVNQPLARLLGVDPNWLASEAGIAMVAGNQLPEGASPLSAAYAGHQFGGWNPQLGDGRAVLLGEVIGSDGERYDIQLKGSGKTPWSRGGDGRAPLGPVLREYIVSEAMARLGVPTSRSLAAVTTGESVYRETAQPGAVLARVAKSHIRIGTFQYFAARQDREALELLVQHCLDRHFPDSDYAKNPALCLLGNVVRVQAELVARWQLLGFIHGVMNTDNMLISGETIDYGPCAFMDEFNPDTVFSSIDHGGRYAYRNQPSITHWNLSCLAQCLLPLLDTDEDRAVEQAQAAIDSFPAQFLTAHASGMRAKLGLNQAHEGDEKLVEELLSLMTDAATDFTLTFRHLADLADPDSAAPTVNPLIELPASFEPWLNSWRQRAGLEEQAAAERQQAMYAVNPVFIARNHLVEAAIREAVDEDNLETFHQLVEILESPFDYHEDFKAYALPARPEQRVHQTFCGT